MLSDARIRKIKPEPTKKRYADEKGMYLEVTPAGSKLWRMKYRFNGKENVFSMGAYPEVSLAEAREKRDHARKLIADGIDPNQAKKKQTLEADPSTLFKTLALEWLEGKMHTISVESYKRDLRAFEKDYFPYIGDTPIQKLRGVDILFCAEKIQERGALELAKRAIPLAGRVFRYAIRKGIIENDPTPHLGEALKPRKVKHMARLEISEFPEFLRCIDNYSGGVLIRLAMQFLSLTFVRTKELRFMEWSELDLDAKEWRIPAHKMKMDLPHIVPLSKQAIAILEQIREYTGTKPYVFYNYSSGKPLSENAILQAIENMGYKYRMTGHGFRGIASTALHEQGYMHDAIELQQAHKVGNSVSQAYNHAQHLKYRANMMQEWADYIDTLRLKVIQFPKRNLQN